MRKITHAEIPIVRKQILIAQGHKCGICGVSFSDAKIVKGKLVPKYTACLDHDHTTGHLRGVICNSCNGIEGKIKTKINYAKKHLTHLEWLTKLTSYLTQHATLKDTSLLHPTHKSDDEKRLLKNKRARNKRAALKAAKLIGTTNAQD